jgi:hypothetical protein
MKSDLLWLKNGTQERGVNKMFGNLLKAAIGLVVETPVALIADVVTMGGVLSDKKQPYTATALEKVIKNVEESTK